MCNENITASFLMKADAAGLTRGEQLIETAKAVHGIETATYKITTGDKPLLEMSVQSAEGHKKAMASLTPKAP